MAANSSPTLAWIAGGDKESLTDKDHVFTTGDRVEKQIAIINDDRVERPYTGTWCATLAGREIGTGRVSGNVAPGTSRFELIGFDLPAAGEGKSDGEVTIAVRIGEAEHKNALSFRAFSLPQATKHAVVAIDPAGLTTKVLRSISTEVTA
jgi:hypothetical protein